VKKLASSTAKLKVIPSGYRVIDTPAGTFLQKKTRRTRQYKLSKAKRQALSRASRRFKVPVVTSAAIIVGMHEPVAWLHKHNYNKTGWRGFGTLTLRNYTGIWINQEGEVKFQPKHALKGAGSLFLTYLLRRSGITKPVNRMLTRMRIPITLS